MLSVLLEYLSPVIEVVGAYLLVAVILAYTLRWTDLKDERWAAWAWPISLLILVWVTLHNGIEWLSRLFVSSLDRMIYKITRHKIDESEYGILWEGRMPYGRHVEVEVNDSTGKYAIPVSPDEDALLVREATSAIDSNGAFLGWRDDAIRVSIKTAKQAVEWTYYLKDGELNSIVRA